ESRMVHVPVPVSGRKAFAPLAPAAAVAAGEAVVTPAPPPHAARNAARLRPPTPLTLNSIASRRVMPPPKRWSLRDSRDTDRLPIPHAVVYVGMRLSLRA